MITDEKEIILKLIDLLEKIRERPRFYISGKTDLKTFQFTVDAESVDNYLGGFDLVRRTFVRFEQENESYMEISRKRGWNIGIAGQRIVLRREMTKAGKTEEEMTDELITIEIEILQRLLENIS